MMEEETTVNQVESKKIEPDEADNKANPDEGLNITKGPRKILPRYLAGPMGSCHDACKYGNQQATTAKPWKKAHKRVTTCEKKTKVTEENVISLARTKKSESSSNSSPLTSNVDDHNYPVDIKEVTYEKTVTFSEKNSPTFEEIDVSMEPNKSDISQASSEPSPLPVQESSKGKIKRELVKNKIGFGSSSIKETASGIKKEKSTPPNIKKKKPAISSAKTAKYLTEVSYVEEVKLELASNDNLPDKILHVIEPTSASLSEEYTLPCDASKSPSPSPSPSSSGIRKKTGKSEVSSSSSKKGLKHASVVPSHKSPGNKGKMNTQHKTRSVLRSSSALSSVSSSNSSFRKQKGTTSKSNKAGHGNQGETMKVGYKLRPKRTTIVGVANRMAPPRKLTFRRGKVIEIQPQSNNIPRRLKFRPPRLLSDDNRRDVYVTRKRTITIKEVDGGELNAGNIKTERGSPKHQSVEGGKYRSVGRRFGVDRSKVYVTKSSGSEKVVLRHQNVVGKKQNPRLYNNVIEETATMLAEIRKSKVKALVGAFETVISLDSPREGTHAEVTTAF